ELEFLQVLITGLGQGCLYGLIALGFVLIYKASEIVNFAQGDLLMLGAFFAVTYMGILGLPFWIAFLLTIFSMAVFGYLLDMLVIRSMIGESQLSVIILTISIGFILRSVAGGIWGSDILSLETPYSGEMAEIAGLVIGQEYLVVIAGTIVLSLILYLFFRFSSLGIAMQAASQNQLAAYYMGIPVKRVFSLIWAISALVAAVAGTLMAPISLVSPQMGFLGIKAFAAAVIGGFGSLPGALIGGLIIGSSEQLAGTYLPTGFQEITAYLIMFLVLTIRPQGLFAQVQQKKV
ncbi:MAG: branched-chain amino acid ABC transporter permease, partial [Desulfobacterales bacterium]|nr:branched-chain amino acid ABC transporter permease [Desulfobacterales bacterium]MDX2513245.1 branched-chain amino acid ABC transporter permease [Desulfobacterales bacterium]